MVKGILQKKVKILKAEKRKWKTQKNLGSIAELKKQVKAFTKCLDSLHARVAMKNKELKRQRASIIYYKTTSEKKISSFRNYPSKNSTARRGERSF